MPTQIPTSTITIREGANARQNVDTADLEASIKHVGIIVPLIVRAIDGTIDGPVYELIAGHRRYAAAINIGLGNVPVDIVETNGDVDERTAAIAAVENIVRTQLTPYEEAIALDTTIKAGYTELGARELLGWSAKRVTERARLLQLPENARVLFDGRVAPSNVVDLAELQRAPKLFDAIVKEYENGDMDEGETPMEAARQWAWNDPNRIECWPAHRALTALALGYDDDSQVAARWNAIREAAPHYLGGYKITDQDISNARVADCLLEIGDQPHIIDRAFAAQLFDDYMKSLEAAQSKTADVAGMPAEVAGVEPAQPVQPGPAGRVARTHPRRHARQREGTPQGRAEGSHRDRHVLQRRPRHRLFRPQARLQEDREGQAR